MENWCVILLRVSTVQQDFEQQKKELIDYSKQLGYDKYYIISDKESGVKLSEEERNGLNELKDLVSCNPNIKGCIVYELSRLARKQSVLHSMKDWFVLNNVNLHIFDKKYNLLNEDGSENENVQLLFSIYGYFAEGEAKQTKIRTMRGKEYWRLKGKLTGGKLVYGYTTDENGYIIPHEERLKLVKYLFDRYINTDITMRQLAKEMIERGKYHRTNLRSAQSWLKCILCNYAYCGQNSIYSPKAPLIYPKTLPKEWIDKAVLKASKAKTLPRTTDNIYWCKSILKQKETNMSFIASITDACYAHRKPFYQQISINFIDSLVWHFVKYMIYPIILNNTDTKTEQQIKEQITINEEKLTTFNKQLKKLDEDFNRAKKLYIGGDLTDTEYNTIKKDNIKNKGILNASIQRLSENNVRLHQTLESRLNRTGILLNDIWNIKDEKEIKRIIDNSVEVIYIDKEDNITIVSKDGIEYHIKYIRKCNQAEYDGKIIKSLKIEERYKNKRKRATPNT